MAISNWLVPKAFMFIPSVAILFFWIYLDRALVVVVVVAVEQLESNIVVEKTAARVTC